VNEKKCFLRFEQIKRERQDVELAIEHKHCHSSPIYKIYIEKDSPTLIGLIFSSLERFLHNFTYVHEYVKEKVLHLLLSFSSFSFLLNYI
jgi:hypothetical protein